MWRKGAAKALEHIIHGRYRQKQNQPAQCNVLADGPEVTVALNGGPAGRPTAEAPYTVKQSICLALLCILGCRIHTNKQTAVD